MSHDRFEEMLARRGELTPAEEQRLQAHLLDCPQCRATAAAFEQQTRLLRALPPVNPPASLRAGVLAGIQQIPPRRRWWPPRPVATLGPAAAALLLVVAALAAHNLQTGESPGNTAAGPAATVPVLHGPTYGPAAAGSNASRKTSSQPKHLSRIHPPAHRPKAPARGTVPTGPPIQSLPSAPVVPAPTAAAPDAAFRPAAPSPVPQPHHVPATAPQSSVKAEGAHPVPTTASAPKPPVINAPARPTTAPAPTTVPLTPVPMTGITTTPPGAASPAAPGTATPTPTSTPQP